MIQKTMKTYTDKEEEFVSLLTSIGTKRNVAKILVYLAKLNEATYRDLERGADLCQPEVSVAMKYLATRGWIRGREIPSEKKGRPVKLWNLALPFTKILEIIGNEKQDELKTRLDMVRKVRHFS